jgi:hypothetical protein
MSKWDPKKMKKAMKESKEEFHDLHKRLIWLLAEFGVRALKTFQAGEKEPLNPLQINQVVTHELEKVIETLQEPKWADLIIRKAEEDFYRLSGRV